MKQILFLISVLCVLGLGNPAWALVWGVNPTGTAAELINIDPMTGAIATSYSLGGMISEGDTEIGLAGFADSLYYTNADLNNGLIYTIDPDTGSTTGSFSVSGGWHIDGLGYYADAGGSWLYTSGCSVNDVHRYEAVGGSGPQFFWSNVDDPQAMAGDNGGRIFTYGNIDGQRWGIYEIDPLTNTTASYVAASPSDSIVGMAFDGEFIYLSDMDNMLYTLGLDGTVLNALEMNYSLYALASTEGVNNPVPEPATLLLLGMGLLGIGSLRRKRK